MSLLRSVESGVLKATSLAWLDGRLDMSRFDNLAYLFYQQYDDIQRRKSKKQIRKTCAAIWMALASPPDPIVRSGSASRAYTLHAASNRREIRHLPFKLEFDSK
jgi:hypothetical protein